MKGQKTGNCLVWPTSDTLLLGWSNEIWHWRVM